MGHTVTDASWNFYSAGNNRVIISEQRSYQGRFEYIGNKVLNCTLKIRNTVKSDKRDYTFTFSTKERTRSKEEKPLRKTTKTIQLSVTGKQVPFYVIKVKSFLTISPTDVRLVLLF